MSHQRSANIQSGAIEGLVQMPQGCLLMTDSVEKVSEKELWN
jgi:hypothetical protein